jgi:hypothetical protein
VTTAAAAKSSVLCCANTHFAAPPAYQARQPTLAVGLQQSLAWILKITSLNMDLNTLKTAAALSTGFMA